MIRAFGTPRSRAGLAPAQTNRNYLTGVFSTGMIFQLSEKGKPIERWGRRATGPQQVSRATEQEP